MNAALLTTQQVAEFLGLADETVLAWAEKGELPGFRLPHGPLRFKREDVDRWLEARAVCAVERASLQHVREESSDAA